MKSSFNHSKNQENYLAVVELNFQKNRCSLFPRIDQMFTDDCKAYLIGQGCNANIRSFYIVVLKIIQKQKRRQIQQKDPKDMPMLNQFKRLLYRQSTILTCIKNIPKIRVENKSKNGTTLTTIETKKLIGEFLNELILDLGNQNRLQNLFTKYSFIHILLNVFMRSLLWLQFDTPNSTDYNETINDSDVFPNLAHLFGIENINISDDSISLTNFIIGVYPFNNFKKESQQNRSRWKKTNIYFIKQKKEEEQVFNKIRTLSRIVQIGKQVCENQESIPEIDMKKVDSENQQCNLEYFLDSPLKKQVSQAHSELNKKLNFKQSVQETLSSDGGGYVKP